MGDSTVPTQFLFYAVAQRVPLYWPLHGGYGGHSGYEAKRRYGEGNKAESLHLPTAGLSACVLYTGLGIYDVKGYVPVLL